MLAYCEAIENKNTITVDCYSNLKTLKGALNELGRYINRTFNTLEGNFLMVSNKEEAKEMLLNTPESSCDGFFITVEEVSHASYLNPITDKLEYKDGYNFYICCRFLKI